MSNKAAAHDIKDFDTFGESENKKITAISEL